MRWSLALVAVCSLAGCDALLGIHHLDGDAGGGGDAAARDSGPTIDAAPVCLGSATFTLCVGAPSSGIMLPSSIDTDTLSCPKLVTADGQKWCVFAGTDITLDGGVTTTVTGQFPLVLFATGTIHIAGTLDAGSHAGGSSGPAANGAQCVAPNVGTNANDVENGGAAGAGGSFASIGGNGGTGELGTAAGQETGPLAAPTQLVGGCPGSTGGAGAEPGTDECTPNASDPAGAGGGAVALLAGTAIIVDGAVSVSGAGGGAGRLARGGGAGGGTGGMIVAAAPGSWAAARSRRTAAAAAAARTTAATRCPAATARRIRPRRPGAVRAARPIAPTAAPAQRACGRERRRRRHQGRQRRWRRPRLHLRPRQRDHHRHRVRRRHAVLS